MVNSENPPLFSTALPFWQHYVFAYLITAPFLRHTIFSQSSRFDPVFFECRACARDKDSIHDVLSHLLVVGIPLFPPHSGVRGAAAPKLPRAHSLVGIA